MARAAGRAEADEILAEHVRNTVDLLLDRSRILADRVEAGQAAVVGLCYRLWPTGAPGWRQPAVSRAARRRGHSRRRPPGLPRQVILPCRCDNEGSPTPQWHRRRSYRACAGVDPDRARAPLS